MRTHPGTGLPKKSSLKEGVMRAPMDSRLLKALVLNINLFNASCMDDYIRSQKSILEVTVMTGLDCKRLNCSIYYSLNITTLITSPANKWYLK